MARKRTILLRAAFIASLCAAIYANQLSFMVDTGGRGGASIRGGGAEMPPSLALITVALGPLRGLVVDGLWWRVSDLQEQGEYFEILNITDWITTLDPGDPFVWTFHSWNLSYNIAYEFPTPETRWKWVEAGMKLLRDDALGYIPDNKMIESELAYFFLDRIGGFTEPAREYYIERWAENMGRYLKSGDRDELIMLASAKSGALEKRSDALERKLKLRPERMLRLDKRYGPFQWRLPQAQAVYWGAREKDEDYRQGDLNYRSVVSAAMRQAFLYGSIVEDEKAGLFVVTHNFEVTRSIIVYYEKELGRGGHKARDRGVFNDFAKRAAAILYAFDRRDLAYELYMARRKLVDNGDERNFRDYIQGTLTKMLKSSLPPRYKQTMIEIQLYNAYKALRSRNLVQAKRLADKAEKQWNEHQAPRQSPMAMYKLPPFESLKAAALAKLMSRMKKQQRERFARFVQSKKIAKLALPEKIDVAKLEIQ